MFAVSVCVRRTFLERLSLAVRQQTWISIIRMITDMYWKWIPGAGWISLLRAPVWVLDLNNYKWLDIQCLWSSEMYSPTLSRKVCSELLQNLWSDLQKLLTPGGGVVQWAKCLCLWSECHPSKSRPNSRSYAHGPLSKALNCQLDSSTVSWQALHFDSPPPPKLWRARSGRWREKFQCTSTDTKLCK